VLYSNNSNVEIMLQRKMSMMRCEMTLSETHCQLCRLDAFIIGVTAPLLELLRQDRIHSGIAVRMNTEISWLFAFLTAKEDSTVSALIAQGLIEVTKAGLNSVSLQCSVGGGKVFSKKTCYYSFLVAYNSQYLLRLLHRHLCGLPAVLSRFPSALCPA
jgi:hypothetical protein